MNPATAVPDQRPAAARRNPGPGWGYQFLGAADRFLPELVFKPARALGTWIALARMTRARRHSREYLALVLPRRPRVSDVFRHFFAFEESLMTRLRLANGAAVPCEYAPGAVDFQDWLAHGGPMLLGTFHVGWSDMLGYQLSGLGGMPVYLVRERVGNSYDTEALARKFGDRLRFIWVNERVDLIFALKEAAAHESVIAMQCDRPGFSARNASFDFLGARRQFSFTIYHLALIFERPVILTCGVPVGPRRTRLHASPQFVRAPGEARGAALARAHAHFQSFLHDLEALLREQPYQWFNFLPLNPAEPATSTR